MMTPLQHRSALRILTPLFGVAGLSLQDETPLFAADRDFAWEHGGPITRAFIATLPTEHVEKLIIDSSLVWLAPGLVHGIELGPSGRLNKHRSPPRFVHEQFPGIANGVRGASNRNRAVVQRLCVLGLDCTPEVAVGDFEFSHDDEAEKFWLPMESLEPREAEIERRLANGTLIRELIPLGVIVEYGWGTLMRARRAATIGFQFVLRATMGDSRPPVNGCRNISQL